MRRSLAPAALLPLLALGAPPASRGQTPSAPPAPEPPAVRLAVEPMAAPEPVLAYRLLPELRDRSTGNALLLYYRAFSPEWSGYRRDEKLMERVQKAAEGPLKDVPREELRWLLTSKMLQEVDRGARRSYCDWELLDRIRQDGLGLVLPDVHPMRVFSTLLLLRARLELLEGLYDQAARTLQTHLQLARDMGRGPTLIQTLVGLAVANQALNVVEDWVQQPGAPNLYWALTDLPRPLVGLRNGLQGERVVIDSLLPGFRDMLARRKAAPVPAASLHADLAKYRSYLEGTPDARLELLAMGLRTYPEAKRFLRSQGWSAEEVEALPALQVVLLYQVHHYDVLYDEVRAAADLPYPEAVKRLDRVMESLRQEVQRAGGHGGSLAALLIPAPQRVLNRHAALERRLAALRCVEAVRLHAVAHGGKPPARLADVREVPVPRDPYTGEEFDYRADGDRFVLTGRPLAGDPLAQFNVLRYEVTVRPKGGER
jgi:hypothetical protein